MMWLVGAPCGNDPASSSRRARLGYGPVWRQTGEPPGRKDRRTEPSEHSGSRWKARVATRLCGLSFEDRCPPETAVSSNARARN
jgi:hypothetical protein